MNDIHNFRTAFSGVTPWSGTVAAGFIADFLGTFTDARFRPLYNAGTLGQRTVETTLPSIGHGGNGEGWFEAVNWLEAAKNARGQFIMISLGAHFGGQLVGAHHMLQLVNPMPCMLVAVEGEPSNYAWISEHMKANGIDPHEHWLIPMAISDTHEPVLFPVGAPGVGSNNCFSTNVPQSRKIYADLIIRDGDPRAALRSLFLKNSTGFTQPVHPDVPIMTEVKVVSAVTLADLLGPFDLVDYIEADIQQSEIVVFPPFMDDLRKKVRRIHIGTHGKDVHDSLHNLFVKTGWNIVFSFAPNSQHGSALGKFELNDGVLTVTNPELSGA
jgi:hypothetical protein